MKPLIYTLLSLLGFATLVAVLRIYGLVEQDLNNIIFNWLLTISPIILAVAAFWSIWENRRIRKVDRELESRRRRLNDLQLWVDEALRLKSAAPYSKYGPLYSTIDPNIALQIGLKVKDLLARTGHPLNEAELVDADLNEEQKIRPRIERLAHIFEHQTNSNFLDPKLQKEMEDNCFAIIKAIDDLRAKWQL